MAKKITVIIPNYNGQILLATNLPKVIKNCPNCEIIVIDDASSDDSVNYLQKAFKTVKVLQNESNLGFAATVNRGVNNASGELVLLLNSDVSPRPDFLKEAIIHFDTEENDSSRIFAVGLADYSHEGGKIVVNGKGGAVFRRGFLIHFSAGITAGETLWASGGSSLVDRKKFLSLGGFDTSFAPFYWEDIDLSYRARKMGLICLFEPKARVDHFHQKGAIIKTFSNFYIKSISYKNQFIFVWKNISDYWLLTTHVLWLPFHLTKSLLTCDWAFFVGFFKAIIKLPNLMFSNSPGEFKPQLSDREVLKNFEKP